MEETAAAPELVMRHVEPAGLEAEQAALIRLIPVLWKMEQFQVPSRRWSYNQNMLSSGTRKELAEKFLNGFTVYVSRSDR